MPRYKHRYFECQIQILDLYLDSVPRLKSEYHRSDRNMSRRSIVGRHRTLTFDLLLCLVVGIIAWKASLLQKKDTAAKPPKVEKPAKTTLAQK